MQEFKEFVRAIESVKKATYKTDFYGDKPLTKDKKQISAYILVDTFKRNDVDKNGNLDPIEFCQALWEVLKLIKENCENRE